eukprot:gene2642-biopygen2019
MAASMPARQMCHAPSRELQNCSASRKLRRNPKKRKESSAPHGEGGYGTCWRGNCAANVTKGCAIHEVMRHTRGHAPYTRSCAIHEVMRHTRGHAPYTRPCAIHEVMRHTRGHLPFRSGQPVAERVEQWMHRGCG